MALLGFILAVLAVITSVTWATDQDQNPTLVSKATTGQHQPGQAGPFAQGRRLDV
jgi:hypothetical protein